jgi:drug/metabolite transporter (DMT)-like permease
MNATTLGYMKTGWTHPMFWPGLFILMWSSGYVAGKLALPYAGPFTLLFLRFSVAAAVLLLVAVLTKASWPKSASAWGHLAVVGLLIQALQFSGLYYGLSQGVSAGVSALIVGLMPAFTAIGAVWLLHEKITLSRVAGLALGLIGVLTVVSNKISLEGGSMAAYGAVALALTGITLGTLYQKKFCSNMDLRTGGFVQLTVATAVALVLALTHEGLSVQWTPALVGSSLWLSLVNSIGAISVLFLLMRRGEASRVAGLFYLIPSVTALMGYAVLSEALTTTQILGFLLSAGGVYLTTRK